MNMHHHMTLRTLRECQSRSAREQQILSGRDWLFVTALVQFLTALYPLYRWVMDIALSSHGVITYSKDMKVATGMLAVSAVLLVLWWWGKFAPFRAACTAFAFYVLLQLSVAIYRPEHMMDSLASKVLVLLGLIMAVRTGYRRRHSG